MSEKKTKAEETKAEETKKLPASEELVEFTAPLLPGTKQKDLWLAVNGETCVVKRGIPVKIKRKFYEAYMNSQEQRVAAYKAMVDLQKQGEKPAAEM